MDNSARHALAALDRALLHRPETDGADFSEASLHLAALRDAMIAQGARGARLSRVNAVLSVALGGQFPLGKIPWATVQAARDELALLAAGS